MELRRYRSEQKVGCLLMLLISPVFVVAQSGTSTRGTRPDPIQRELQRRFESEAIERALSASPRRRPEYEWRILIAQIREDFLRIQVVNNDIRKSAAGSVPLDLKLIAKSVGEISKCAQRLKVNLALPKSETAAAVQAPTDQGAVELRSSLLLLDGVIYSFVANPVFEKSGVVDVNLSAQASRDLDQIIAVSKQVKKSSEKLRRPTVPVAAKSEPPA